MHCVLYEGLLITFILFLCLLYFLSVAVFCLFGFCLFVCFVVVVVVGIARYAVTISLGNFPMGKSGFSHKESQLHYTQFSQTLRFNTVKLLSPKQYNLLIIIAVSKHPQGTETQFFQLIHPQGGLIEIHYGKKNLVLKKKRNVVQNPKDTHALSFHSHS